MLKVCGVGDVLWWCDVVWVMCCGSVVVVCVWCVLWWCVLFVLWCCCVLWCVVCHAENPPCVYTKRLRVYVQNVSVCAGTTRTC